MRYMMLIYGVEDDSASPEELQEVSAAHHALMADLHERGILVGADPLYPTTSATTVRVKDGKPMVTDGPFAETKEQLAGYYILDCKDLDEAIEWAAKIPTRCKGGAGCIEVRPIWQIEKPA